MSFDPAITLPEDLAISVRNVSRSYMLFNRPQDRLKHAIWRGRKKFYHDFWALKNVSFDVKKGESVGIIGRNGSGKSTLLQIITGILPPTEGEVLIRGRVVALLELGSGFNPDFTGRENIYLNGKIVGLSEKEMDERYEDIIAFADIGEFIDQPVKTYSSGMVVRLAFSVLAHVDPDVLIIDEALAVGDLAFQLKCTVHIKKLIDKGATLLFVSHDSYAVKNLCKRALWLHEGTSRFFGNSFEAVARYQDFLRELDSNKPTESDGNKEAENPGQGGGLNSGSAIQCRLLDQKILDANNNEITEIHRGETIKVRVEYEVYQEIGPLSSGVAILDSGDYFICGTNTHLQKISIPSKIGRHGYEVIYNNLNLFAGTYKFDIGLFNENTTVFLDYHSRCLELKIIDEEHLGDGLILLNHKYVIL
ncbi:MAG: ABC transporter ATP-binding protein [Nitrospinae bacterium]|nr:ABC transporter ATP-binding protein [Nitrospinota bacterium]